MAELYSQHKQCLISGQTPLKPLKGYEKHYLVKSPIGFVFCSRIPTEKELQDEYGAYNRSDFYSPITKLRYHELLAQFEPFRKTNKILDIGCGNGYFLDEAKAKGWEVHGTEYTDNVISDCERKGISMQKGILKASNYSAGMFDVITSFEVIEHINNPREEIANIHKILRKGGLVYLTTPNFNSLERMYLKDNYTVINYPEHLSYYTANTLNYLFSTNGFRKKKIATTGISFSRFRGSVKRMKHIENHEALISATSADEVFRVKSQSNLFFKLGKNGLNAVLNFFKVGNSLKGWFIKA